MVMSETMLLGAADRKLRCRANAASRTLVDSVSSTFSKAKARKGTKPLPPRLLSGVEIFCGLLTDVEVPTESTRHDLNMQNHWSNLMICHTVVCTHTYVHNITLLPIEWPEWKTVRQNIFIGKAAPSPRYSRPKKHNFSHRHRTPPQEYYQTHIAHPTQSVKQASLKLATDVTGAAFKRTTISLPISDRKT